MIAGRSTELAFLVGGELTAREGGVRFRGEGHDFAARVGVGPAVEAEVLRMRGVPAHS